MKRTSKLTTLFTSIVIATMLGTATADETTQTASVQTQSDTLTPAQEAAAESTSAVSDSATRTVILLGENISAENPDSPKGPFANLVDLTTATLGGKVTDLTKHGQTIAAMKESAKQAVQAKPDVVIIFTGYSDEKAAAAGKPESSDDNQTKYLKAIVSAIIKTGARVFIVPASTTMGASGNAKLRIVASEQNATFVPMGTEVSGQPFEEAFAGIQAELENPQQVEAAPAPSKSVFVTGRTIQAPGASTAEPADYGTKKASLQKELDRIAGESGTDSAPLERTLITTDTEKLLSADSFTSSSAYPPGGTITKTGSQAQENINMRPLPAVKAFRPQIPVPRNQIDVKEPDISR